MSEIPAPYGHNSKGHKKSDLERIAHFMNGYLGRELLMDISYSEILQGDYRDLSDELKKEWFAFTAHELFKESTFQIVGILARQLKPVESNLIKRRIADYLISIGIEFEED